MDKTTIKRLLVYFLVRDFLPLLVVLGFMSRGPVQEYTRGMLKGLLPFILFYLLPLVVINALLFGWPYAYLLRRYIGEKSLSPYIWYGMGLLMLEAILLKITIYNEMHLRLLIFVILYLLIFTWIYFRRFIARNRA